MALLNETFEGGTNGATMTTSNSTFQTVGTGITFTNTPTPVEGVLAMANTQAAATSSFASNTFTAAGQVYRRFYAYLPALPVGGIVDFVISRAGATNVARVSVTTTGAIQLRNTGTTVYTSSATLPTGGWFRVEYLQDSTNGLQQVQVFTGVNLHGPTPDIDSGGVTLSTLQITELRIGQLNSATTSSTTIYYDAVADSQTAWVGPLAGTGVNYTRAPADTATGSDTASVAKTASGSDAAAATDAVGVTLTAFTETFERGTLGAALTPANTGFSDTPVGATFVDSPSLQGGLVAQFAPGTGTVSFATSAFGASSAIYRRFYVYLPALPVGGAFDMSAGRAAGSTVARLAVNTSGSIVVRDASTIMLTSAPLITPGSWARVEWKLDGGAGAQRVRVFVGGNANGTSPDLDTGELLLTTMPTTLRFGMPSNSTTAPATAFYDAILDAPTWPGPDASAPTGAVTLLDRAQAKDSGIAALNSTNGLPNTPALLTRPGTQVITGITTTKWADPIPADDQTYDFRGAEFQGYFWADAQFGYGTFAGDTATAHQKNNVPFSVGETKPAERPVVVGGKVLGDQPTTLTWNSMKFGSPVQDALDAGFDNTYARSLIPAGQDQDGDPRLYLAAGSWAVIDGLRVYNTHDGFGLFGATSTLADAGTVYFRNTWVLQNHDDSIENDVSQLGLDVTDCLFEQVYSFISTRAPDTSGAPNAAKPQTVRDSIVWLSPRPGPDKQTTSTTGHGYFYKSQTNSPPLVLTRCILAAEKPNASGALDLPMRPGLDSYTDVTIVWLGTGSYPSSVPPGCTLTTDRSVLDNAVATWKLRHGVTDFTTVDSAQMIAPLTAGTTPFGSDTATATDAVSYHGTRLTLAFFPPVQQVLTQLVPNSRLFASTDWGLAVLLIGGQWITTMTPTAEQVAAADRYFAGGRQHVLTPEEHADLLAGGFADYITTLSEEIIS